MLSSETNTYINAKNVLTNYIKSKGLRNTPERQIILEKAYQIKKHFDASSLYNELLKEKYYISKTTIYNTLKLLVECQLLIEHNYEKDVTFFESYKNNTDHDHLICKVCKKVIEFKNPAIKSLKTKISRQKGFTISHHQLYIYGECKNCIRKKKRQLQKIKNK